MKFCVLKIYLSTWRKLELNGSKYQFNSSRVELVLKQGYKVKDAADTMNIGQPTLKRKMGQYREEQLGVTPKAIAMTDEHWQTHELEAFSSTVL